MKNPFKPDEFSPQVLKRQPRDLSHRKVFTTEFGKGMPVLCQEVFPGDTVKLENIDLKIQGMPTYFPLTSRLKVSVSYFYCRNRCVDQDWEDFIFNTKPIDKAWLRMDAARAKIMISTGSLGDMFGIPSTVGDDSTSVPTLLSFGDVSSYGLGADFGFSRSDVATYYSLGRLLPVKNSSFGIGAFAMTLSQSLTVSFDSYSFGGTCNENYVVGHPESGYYFGAFVSNGRVFFVPISLQVVSAGVCEVIYDSSLSSLVDGALKSIGSYQLGIVYVNFSDGALSSGSYLNPSYRFQYSLNASTTFNEVLDSTDDRIVSGNVYVGVNPVNKLEAHAFRHYTMIGNYYYRNERNNPYVLNGQVEYNKFIPTKASGPDDNVYDFFYRNWELDRFTSCCQTPQQGDAPLVGLSVNGSVSAADLTFQATDSEGVSHDYVIRVGVDKDYRIDSIANFDDTVPSAVLQRVTDMISYGTSINNLRVTNSFQRFKERAQHGLRYRVQMKSHLGVNVDYPDIDIPQYIGGFNGDINSFRNENMAASEYANLGDFNGSLFGNFSSQHPITLQVPEHGYIMGIMTIVPVPMYPQSVTNKALIKRSPFEYPLQEFMKVGNEPVLYSEVMPLQNGLDQSPDDVFGYRRPFAEYLNNLDEVHGDFRTTLRNFNCVRMFSERPELSAQFTTVHPEELNQVFIAENIADKYGSNSKFLCSIDYKISALRQIPDGDPALE